MISLFFSLGALLSLLQALREGRLKLQLKQAFSEYASLFLSIGGLLLLAALVGEKLSELALSQSWALVPGLFLGPDMGAHTLATAIEEGALGRFSGLIVSSLLGATLSFSLPMALGMIEKNRMSFFRGFRRGLMTIPAGLLAGALLLGVPMKYFLMASIFPPLLGISFPAGRGRRVLQLAFRRLNEVGILVGLGGALGFYSLPLGLFDVLGSVFQIELVILGGYFFYEKLGTCHRLSKETRLVALLLISSIPVMREVDHLSPSLAERLGALSVSGAFLLGGQMGYCLLMDSKIGPAFFLSKSVAAIAALIFTLWASRQKNRKNI